MAEIPESYIDRTTNVPKSWNYQTPKTYLTENPYKTNAKKYGGPSRKKPAAPSGVTYAVGDTVRHKAFGTGVILTVTPMGNDQLLEIAFDKAGTKKVMANFARLTKV